MITNKDIRVDNGNLVINGDKYPLDGQSPETIMQIVEDNSDTTPTENSDAPITSGGVFAADKDITDTIGDLTQTGVTGATVAAQIGELDDNALKIGTLTSASTSVAAGAHMFIDIALTDTLPTNIISIFVSNTANSAWIFANYQERDATKVRIGAYNTHPTEALSGTYTVTYLYK